MKKKWYKKAMESEMIGWWIIAIVVLVIMIIGYMIFKDKGIGAVEYVKNLFRLRGGGSSGGGGASGTYELILTLLK